MKLRLQLADTKQRHLPLMVVRAVTWARSGLLFAAHVKTQVFNCVVLLVAVHMVYALSGSQGAAEVFSHDPTMLENASPPESTRVYSSHFIEHGEFVVPHRVLTKNDITAGGNGSAGRIASHSKGSGLWQCSPAWPTGTSKVWGTGQTFKVSSGNPAPLFAVRTSNLRRRSGVSILSERFNLRPVYGGVHG